MTASDDSDPTRPESEPQAEPATDVDAPAEGAARPTPRVPTRITADEDVVDDLVGGLFRDVDSRFTNLEQRVQKARESFSEDDVDRVRHRDLVAASAARDAVATEVATLRADVERQATELVARSRQIEDLRARLSDAEARVGAADERAVAAESRLSEAEQRDAASVVRVSESDERAAAAEARVDGLDGRVVAAEARAAAAEERAGAAEASVSESEERAAAAEVRADELEERAAAAEERAAAFETEVSESDERAVAAGARADAADETVQALGQELHEERREMARIRALLEARSVEREELANATERLQIDKEQSDLQLAAALESVEEVDRLRAQLVDDVAQLEATRNAEAHEHRLRQQDLADARAEIRNLTEQVADLSVARDEARQQADRASSSVERRAAEVSYLNRRIDSLTERAAESDQLESEVKGLLEQQTVLARQVADLQRELETKTAEAAASAKAVESIAERAAQHDDLVVAVASLEAELAEAKAAVNSAEEAALGAQAAVTVEAEARVAAETRAAGAEIRVAEATAEADAAHAALTAGAAADPAVPPVDSSREEVAPSEPGLDTAPLVGAGVDGSGSDERDGDPDATTYVAPRLPVPEMPMSAEPVPDAPAAAAPAVPDLVWADDLEPADDTGPKKGELPTAPPPELAASTMVEGPAVSPADEPAPPSSPVPRVDIPTLGVPPASGQADPAPDLEPIEELADAGAPEPGPAEVAEPESVGEVAAPEEAADVVDTIAGSPAEELPTIDEPAAASPFSDATAASEAAVGVDGRRRLILPAEMQPDTPEAVEYLLAQPRVTAIVDARSFCGRTGVRPSELFDRIAALRDRFDIAVEVVVTPVSTPVGGAPDLPAIGVHHVTGADTVSDRVRALCIGFPPDQQLVVVAGDDHVRRAAIGEEANVVDPAVVVDVT